MYTNIDTEHALKVIAIFLRTSPLCSDISAEPIISGLGIIMRNNVFRFGDTFWLQRTGTAMGTRLVHLTPLSTLVYMNLRFIRASARR